MHHEDGVHVRQYGCMAVVQAWQISTLCTGRFSIEQMQNLTVKKETTAMRDLGSCGMSLYKGLKINVRLAFKGALTGVQQKLGP